MMGCSRLNEAIAAEPSDKVKALIVALEDGEYALFVIKALQEFGKDAEPALPLLKKLKLSSVDGIRQAATEAIKKIE
jgi:hypothetical protein